MAYIGIPSPLWNPLNPTSIETSPFPTPSNESMMTLCTSGNHTTSAVTASTEKSSRRWVETASTEGNHPVVLKPLTESIVPTISWASGFGLQGCKFTRNIHPLQLLKLLVKLLHFPRLKEANTWHMKISASSPIRQTLCFQTGGKQAIVPSNFEDTECYCESLSPQLNRRSLGYRKVQRLKKMWMFHDDSQFSGDY